jgi:hypothetical protein
MQLLGYKYGESAVGHNDRTSGLDPNKGLGAGSPATHSLFNSVEMFVSYGDKFQVVFVNGIAVNDVSEHLEGVAAVIHAVTPPPGRGDAKTLLSVLVSQRDIILI